MDTLKGIITKGTGGLYTVNTGNENIQCRAKGIFRHKGIKPLAGDIVSVLKNDDEYSIAEIHERKNSLIRPPLANLDYLFIVASAASPAPSKLTIDKLICASVSINISPVIIITKEDIDNETAKEYYDTYTNSGFPTFLSSIDSDKKQITDFIKTNCKDSIIAFAGNSGVGKSTIMNSIFKNINLETGDISQKTERGKHTTRLVELFELSLLLEDETFTGWAADTPGFSMLDFINFDFIKLEDLPESFPEFKKYLGTCKYKKCTHTVEEGCSIVEAVKNGTIQKSRHESYCSIRNDIKDKHDWD